MYSGHNFWAYSLLITHYSLLITQYSVLSTHYSLLIIYYSLIITHDSLFIMYKNIPPRPQGHWCQGLKARHGHPTAINTHYSVVITHDSLLIYSLLCIHYALLITHYPNSLLTAHYSLLISTDFVEAVLAWPNMHGINFSSRLIGTSHSSRAHNTSMGHPWV